MVLRGKWQGVSESRVPGGRGESVCVELSNSLRVRYARVERAYQSQGSAEDVYKSVRISLIISDEKPPGRGCVYE